VIHLLILAMIHRQVVVSAFQKCIMLHKQRSFATFLHEKNKAIFFVIGCVTVLYKTQYPEQWKNIKSHIQS